MVDAARQMLDELMGRNRNLHPTEAVRKIQWDDPDFCQYYIVYFCPHDLFVNTRADLGPCQRIHDDEAKSLYQEARPSPRKRQYEDDFLRFCNNMLNDVDRKIQKGKQRLQLMQKDHHPIVHLSKYQEQLNVITARIKKLVAEAEEAGIRGDVDQAKDLMTLCEQLKIERDSILSQHENAPAGSKGNGTESSTPEDGSNNVADGVKQDDNTMTATETEAEKKQTNWLNDMTTMEKQMEVCETCGAFLIVGDAQQRIEDHLMGKQHLGYSKLRKAVEEINNRRAKEREEEEKRRREEREERNKRTSHNYDNDRRRDHRDCRDYRGHSRDYRHSSDQSRHRHHHKSHDRHDRHARRSHSRSRSSRSHRHESSRDRSRSRSRSRSHSRH